MSQRRSGRKLAVIVVGAVLLLGGVTGLAITLTGGGSETPEVVGVEDFCEEYTGITEAMQDVDLEASRTEQAEQMVAAMQRWADGMARIGTPDDMPDDAREGFGLMLETIQGFDPDDFDSPQAFARLQDSFTDEQRERFDALEEYVAGVECGPFDESGPAIGSTDTADATPSARPEPSPVDVSDLPTEPTQLSSAEVEEFELHLEDMLSDVPSGWE